MQRRHLLVAGISGVLAACAPPPFKPLEFPPPLPLQDPLPGRAMVYLLRTPDDGATVTVFLSGTKVATLPRGTYTALSLKPGSYAITIKSGSPQPESPVLTVSAGERRFLYTAVPTDSGMSVQFMPAGKAGIVPLLVPQRTRTGARSWRECNESDAQGLLSISKVVHPEIDEL